jgi:hypothetical protein
MENTTIDKPRGRTKRLEKYTKQSAKKINCNRSTCKEKLEYPIGGKHWKGYKQGKKYVKCTEKSNRDRIVTQLPIRRVLYDEEVDKIIRNRFAKLTEAQQNSLRKYLLSPLQIPQLKN